MDTNFIFSTLTATLHLGTLLSAARRVEGGLMHTMYRLNTSKGTFAVKLLNPNVMKRPEAMGNYREADRLELILQNSNIPIVPSLLFDGEKMHKLDGQYYYVYQWFDGKPLKNGDVTKYHCQKIGSALSQIHSLDMKCKQFKRNPILIDWDCYIAIAKENNKVIFDLLNGNKELLYEGQNRGNMAIHKIPAAMAICHNDMDLKNVLWQNEAFRIIDLECLGYSSPYLELFELALCWSGYEACKIDFDLFRAFINAYFEEKSVQSIDWNSLYDSNCGRLEWLEYNVKRALLIEQCTAEEQELGIEQVQQTIDLFIYYSKIKDELISCFMSTI